MTDKEKKVGWRELRREFPNVSADRFLGFVRQISLENCDCEDVEILRLILGEEDERNRLAKEQEEALISERLHGLTRLMAHGDLRIEMPENVDLAHAQAYLMYGMIAPASGRQFVESHSINLATIRKFVANKLGRVFDEGQFADAHRYFLGQGVVKRKADKLSLNIKENDSPVTPAGQAIIREVKRYLYDKVKK